MPAYFESGVFGGGERAWHGMGTVLDDDVFTVERAAELAPEWGSEILTVPVLYTNPVTGQVENLVIGGTDEADALQRYCTVRAYDGKVLGDGLSHIYKARQVVEKFAFLNALVGGKRGKRRAMLHTCGTLEGGAINWMLVRLDGDMHIADDPIARFLFVSDRFDGNGSTEVGFTNVRIVCKNTLDMAVGSAARMFKARHTGDLSEKLDVAAEILELAEAYNAAYYEQAERLRKKRMSGKAVQAFLDALIPLPVAADPEAGGRAAKNAAERQGAIKAILGHDDLANINGTAWGVYNAVAEYEDWYRPARSSAFDTADANRFRRAMMGDRNGGLKTKALDLLVSA